jgi:hypothetical protein
MSIRKLVAPRNDVEREVWEQRVSARLSSMPQLDDVQDTAELSTLIGRFNQLLALMREQGLLIK